jgi:cytochrome c
MMKAFFFVFIISLVACGENNKPVPGLMISKDTTKTTDTTVVTVPVSINKAIKKKDFETGLLLISKSDCATCHKINNKIVGPTYQEIADKYTIDSKTIEFLIDKIINGGSGNWGQIPMLPHAMITKEDADKMVKYILALKKD